MRSRLLLSIAVAALVAPALFAGSLEKYKNWSNSPQGYFMTAAERADWKANVKTDAEAEEFVKKFLARRDSSFAADVAQRAEMADKHLSLAGRAGSLTTRGKIVILLGPPASFVVTDRAIKGNIAGTADMYASIGSNGNDTHGNLSPAVGDIAMAANNRSMTENLLKDYTFVYAGDKLPVKQPKDLSIIVEVKPADGTDRIVDRKAAAQLDELFDAVAASRVITKP